ncbi:hypothetical protein MVES1_001459 [Malassezia vespertilionis]|uniref:INO80 complex subunit F domain-containing protein n=1 Tax=Malassezia vespertilionis TaxID=2020962 RepID=A0A2N1JF87_9BASI|nr:uncharacterized protein MVES1_001459 [Malassezia vespertilionis]PKI85224.1 hypothetical protein MVES_001376 [Malassezia vespertilionis]WFD06118.1 hypothetical protein MVES1_001459 [Malassezia vespertilionis]
MAANQSGAGASTKSKSKAYLSSVAIQSDATKYRQKYKELKRKVHEIEQENDKLHVMSLRIKRNIKRLLLERSILYDRMESEMHTMQSHVVDASPKEADETTTAKLEDSAVLDDADATAAPTTTILQEKLEQTEDSTPSDAAHGYEQHQGEFSEQDVDVSAQLDEIS